MNGDSATTSQITSASAAARTPMTRVLRARSVMGSPGTASQRGAALAPGPRLLEGRGGGEDRRVGVAATHDLEANRQPVVGPARGPGGGGLAGGVEREREGHQAEGRGGIAGC